MILFGKCARCLNVTVSTLVPSLWIFWDKFLPLSNWFSSPNTQEAQNLLYTLDMDLSEHVHTYNFMLLILFTRMRSQLGLCCFWNSWVGSYGTSSYLLFYVVDPLLQIHKKVKICCGTLEIDLSEHVPAYTFM